MIHLAGVMWRGVWALGKGEELRNRIKGGAKENYVWGGGAVSQNC